MSHGFTIQLSPSWLRGSLQRVKLGGENQVETSSSKNRTKWRVHNIGNTTWKWPSYFACWSQPSPWSSFRRTKCRPYGRLAPFQPTSTCPHQDVSVLRVLNLPVLMAFYMESIVNYLQLSVTMEILIFKHILKFFWQLFEDFFSMQKLRSWCGPCTFYEETVYQML